MLLWIPAYKKLTSVYWEDLSKLIWSLFLAHFLGDFILQTDWMIRNRDKLWVLSLHAGIHLVLMVLLIGQSRLVLWPYLLLVALIHFLQDLIKILVTKMRPDWIKVSYVIDQFMHYVILLLAGKWILGLELPVYTTEKSPWKIYAIAFIVVSFVWFISERIFNQSNSDYVESINQTKYSRMVTRVGLVGLFFVANSWVFPVLGFVIHNPYPKSEFRWRAVMVDFSVSIAAMIFLFLALD